MKLAITFYTDKLPMKISLPLIFGIIPIPVFWTDRFLSQWQ